MGTDFNTPLNVGDCISTLLKHSKIFHDQFERRSISPPAQNPLAHFPLHQTATKSGVPFSPGRRPLIHLTAGSNYDRVCTQPVG